MGMKRSKTEYTFLTVSGVKYIAYFFRMFYIQLHINLYICLVLYSFAYKTRESTEINAIHIEKIIMMQIMIFRVS